MAVYYNLHMGIIILNDFECHCHCYRFPYNLIFSHLQVGVPSYNIEFIIDTSHLLVGINSAANFFLYLLLRKNFRAATWRILTCKRHVHRSPNTGMTYAYHSQRSKGTLFRLTYIYTKILNWSVCCKLYITICDSCEATLKLLRQLYRSAE